MRGYSTPSMVSLSFATTQPVSKAGAAEFVEERLVYSNHRLLKKSKSRPIPIYVTEVGWQSDTTSRGVSLPVGRTGPNFPTGSSGDSFRI